ncbi:MAG: 4-(cytidine 5'-diphospho)-2-C-methyl-D-erythritol kinase [Bacilli bacterium]|nr:4-(cytidine 5'-diphospho)-2-C-methyl-D-erythritol kinase [Bacilli bacterium]
MFFKPSSLILKSYSKINLSLKVLGQKDDGYHDLEMVVLPVELHDIIEINRFRDGNSTCVTCDDLGLASMQNNLCYRAVEEMRSVFGFNDGFEIVIHKRIPFAAGMGGGSSNAACVISAVCKMKGINVNDQKVLDIAKKIGADVPFFLLCKPALVTGIGENLKELKCKKKYHCLIVKPSQGLSTKAIFDICDTFERTECQTELVIKGLENGDDELLAANIGNDLYKPASSLLPEVSEIVNDLKSMGLPMTAMTGSGSAVFALSTDRALLEKAAEKIAANGRFVEITKIH